MPVATSDALTGFGMPPQLAALLGGNPSALTCVGTAQTGAAVIKSKNTELVTAGGATACVFTSGVGVMEPYFFTQASSTSGLIFVPSGHSLNGSANASLTLAQYKGAIMWQYKLKQWTYILTA